MKKLITVFFTLAFILISFKSFTYRGGPGGAYSNAPGEGNCTSCHGGTSLNGGSGSLSDLTLTSTMKGAGYEPDSTYTFTLKYTQSSISRFGFNLTALDDSTDSPAGDFKNTNSRTQKRTKGVSGKTRQYMEHTSAGSAASSSNTAEWEFEWKAPSTNVGIIKFYAAVNATNNNSGTGGDQVYAKVFSINIDGIPVATASTKDSVVCAGETVSLTGSGTNKPTKYSWIFPGGTPSVSTSQNPTVSFSGFGTKYAILEVENSVGVSQRDTQVITVQQSPTAFISGSNSRTICPSDSTELVAQFNPKYEYKWSTGATTNKIFVSAPGEYFVTTKSGNCSRVSNIITVKNHFVATPTISSSNTNDSICANDLITLTANAAYDSFVWYKNQTQVGKTTKETFAVNVDSGSVFQVRAWSKDQCLSEFSDSVDYIVIDKNEKPKVLCTNTGPFTVTFDWAGVASHKGAQVSVDGGKTWNTPTSGTSGNSHTLSGLDPDTDYDILVRAITKSPCFYSEVTKQVCRTGNCSPINATIQVDTNVCKGDEVTVEVNGLANENYSLNFQSGGAFTDTIFKFSPQNIGNYTLEILDSNLLGCPPKKFVFPMHIDEITDLRFRTDKSSNAFCEGDSIKFTATSGNDEYNFFVNDVLRASLTDSFYYENQFNDGDSAYVEVTKGACKASSGKIYLVVVPTPNPKFTYTNSSSDYSFKPENENYKEYFWEFGDGFTSVLKTPDHNYKASSNKTVNASLMVTDNNNCVANSSQDIDIPDFSSVKDLTQSGVKVYPSPAGNTLTIRWESNSILQTRAKIYTLEGQYVTMFTNSNDEFSIDLSNIVAGLYIIEIQRGDEILRQRLIKN